jgi:hypothetical protein
VRENVAAIYYRIAHGLIWVINAHFCPQAPALTLLGACLHLGKSLQILLGGSVSVLGCNSIHSFSKHLFDIRLDYTCDNNNVTCLLLEGIVSICLSEFYHFYCKIIEVVEVVRGVGDFVSVDFKQFKILQNCLLKLRLLERREIWLEGE